MCRKKRRRRSDQRRDGGLIDAVIGYTAFGIRARQRWSTYCGGGQTPLSTTQVMASTVEQVLVELAEPGRVRMPHRHRPSR